jgi:hypothetical protein
MRYVPRGKYTTARTTEFVPSLIAARAAVIAALIADVSFVVLLLLPIAP